VTAKEQVVMIPGDQPEDGMNGYGWKDQGVKYRTQAWKQTTSDPSGLMPN